MTAPGTLAPPTTTSLVSAIDGTIASLHAADTYVANALSGALSSAYSTLVPTADLVSAGLITLPAYDLNLFLNGVAQAFNRQPVQGIINAIGAPSAADMALVTLGGVLELSVLAKAVQSILDDLL